MQNSRYLTPANRLDFPEKIYGLKIKNQEYFLIFYFLPLLSGMRIDSFTYFFAYFLHYFLKIGVCHV